MQERVELLQLRQQLRTDQVQRKPARVGVGVGGAGAICACATTDAAVGVAAGVLRLPCRFNPACKAEPRGAAADGAPLSREPVLEEAKELSHVAEP